MGDRIDEAVMLLVAPNFADQKNRVHDETGGNHTKKNDAEKNFDTLAPVENRPATTNRSRQPRQANPERQESIDRLLAADDAHREIVAGWGKRCQVFSCPPEGDSSVVS